MYWILKFPLIWHQFPFHLETWRTKSGPPFQGEALNNISMLLHNFFVTMIMDVYARYIELVFMGVPLVFLWNHHFPMAFPLVFLWFSKGTMGTSYGFWTLSEAMKDDPPLLEKLLRLDGRALRYASRKLRGERFVWMAWGWRGMGWGLVSKRLDHLMIIRLGF